MQDDHFHTLTLTLTEITYGSALEFEKRQNEYNGKFWKFMSDAPKLTFFVEWKFFDGSLYVHCLDVSMNEMYGKPR